MDDYSYLGTGHIYMREFGSDAPLVEVGNCSALNLSPQTEQKELRDFTTPGGGLRNEVSRNTGVELAYTFHDFSPANLARALRGGATAVTAGSALDEPHAAYAGGFVKLNRIPSGNIVVTGTGATPPTYAEGVDYEVRPGGIFILPGTSIPAPVGGADNILVDYDYAAQDKLQAMINSAKQYELVFAGMNEARSGKVTTIHCHKVSGGVISQFAAIGEEYGAGEVTGKLLQDTTKTGTGISKYFTVEMEK
jgi:hypothetical protein